MRRAVFIDRDGVICRNREDYVKDWEEFHFLPGALDALARLARTDLRVVVVTNQSAINRGIVPVDVVESIHARMVEAIEARGGRIDGIFYCPHRPDEGCNCRKPRPGLLLQAAEALDLDLEGSYLIGDAESDLQAGRAVGCRRFMVLTGRGRRQLFRCWVHGERGFTVVVNLQAAVDRILRLERHRQGLLVEETARC
ncbi:MAG TPA: D-glycero-beta-D-manno-heptose 1,7-bisphosphate 7-phosphatase [Thermoflexia bacterium]|jgi:D-glycero-D-manno-heptose 1,7-bisphosphate phosphatase|nr:D-glycero-beta-D-manno-heptose 1,7-bisphosphate 7-phosphatase [Thermoflexia bacterium]